MAQHVFVWHQQHGPTVYIYGVGQLYYMQGLAIFGDMPCMIATRLNMRLANLGAVNIIRTSKHIKNKIKKERTKNPRRVDAVIINQVSIHQPANAEYKRSIVSISASAALAYHNSVFK